MICTGELEARLAEALDTDVAALSETTELAGLSGWDSLGHLAVIAVVDEVCGLTLSADRLRACRTFGDVLRLSRSGEPA